MGTYKSIYTYPKPQNKQTDSNYKEDDRPKRNLIFKTPTTHIKLNGTYIEVDSGTTSQIYGVLNIKALYIHKDIKLSVSDCYVISKYIRIYFINSNGYILAKYKRYTIR